MNYVGSRADEIADLIADLTDDDDRSPSAFFVGLAYALLFAAPFWAAVAALVWWLT